MNKARLGALAVAIAGAALLQGCAVVTRPYVAERAAIGSHSMVSRYDKSRYSADGSGPMTSRSSLYMPRARERGAFFFQYY
jgi:hypothetical protein